MLPVNIHAGHCERLDQLVRCYGIPWSQYLLDCVIDVTNEAELARVGRDRRQNSLMNQ